MLSTPCRASRGAAIRNGALALAALLALSSLGWADAAADCRDRDRLSDEQPLPLCTAPIEAATDLRERADLLL